MKSASALSATTFVVFAASIAILIGYVASLGVRVHPPASRTRLSMNVADINNLAIDSNVLLRGVSVGKVTDIDTSDDDATVHFYISGQYHVPANSDVRLENLSALGESYIELEPQRDDGPTFRDGQVIAPDSVKAPASVTQLGASVVRVLNQLDPGQLSRVIGQADVGLPDPNAVLPNLARASMLLRNTTTDFKGQGRALLDNFQVLLQNASFVGPALAGSAPPIRDLGSVLNPFYQQVSGPDAPGMQPIFLFDLSTLLHRIQKLLDDRGTDLRVLGEATSGNLKLIANALKNFDSSQILANLMTTVPADGAIDLHVPIPPQS